MRVLLRIVILFFTSLALVKNNACPLMEWNGEGLEAVAGGLFCASWLRGFGGFAR